MEVLVCYDVNTLTAAGRKRLRRVAIACKNFGQRAQYSVFECQLEQMQYEQLIRVLLKIIEPEEDSLRVYRLMEPREKYLKHYGLNRVLELDSAVIL